MPGRDKSHIPRRSLLADQAAEYVRLRIRQGDWSEELPTETSLCKELQVSRVTLRRALDQLTEEGLIVSGGRGARRRINAGLAQKPATPSGRIIRVLAPFSYWKMGAANHAILEGLSHRVESRDLRVEFECRPQLFTSHRPNELERLAKLPDTAGWVLFYATIPMQQWFAGKNLPCVLAGRRHDDLPLPAAYPDNEAVARHAAGLLVARGHRRMAILIARQTSLGDQLGSIAFLEEARKLGAEPSLVEYAGDPESVRRAMSSVLAARPAPTASFLTCPEDSVTALCHTIQSGVKVPGQMDFLVGWDDPILDYTVPPLTRYLFNGTQMGQKIGNLILRRIEGRGAKGSETRFLGEFSEGGTLRAR